MDFKKIKGPIILFFSIFTFSFLLGLLKDVKWSILLLRALFLGLAGLLFIFLAKKLIELYLPELLSSSEDHREDEEPIYPSKDNMGQNVNILMEEDQYHPPQGEEPIKSVKEVSPKDTDESDDSSFIIPEELEVDSLPSLDKFSTTLGQGESEDIIDSMGSKKTEPNIESVGDPTEIAQAVKTVLKRDQSL